MTRRARVRGRSGATAPVLPDSVDGVVADWHEELPDLPVAPIEVFVRMTRLRTRFDQELSDLFAHYDLSAADFSVIAALRRSGAPYELAQSTLMQRLGLTSGTVSVRLARLEGKGVLTRQAHPTDARGSVVRLTDKGLDLFAEVAPAHLANEDLLLSALTDDERDTLVVLLRKLMVSFEHPRSTSPLGFTVAPAHETRRARQAVGLPDVAGLLLLDVVAGSVADEAGLRQGDVLVAAGEQPVVSCVMLADLTADARREQRPLDLTVLRGARRHVVSLDPAST